MFKPDDKLQITEIEDHLHIIHNHHILRSDLILNKTKT